MKLINLTRHDVVLTQLGMKQSFPRSGITARITESSNYVVREDILFKEISNQKLIGLPDQNGSLYIVSRVVAEHCQRQDLVFPDDLIVENGQVIGCKSLGFLRRSAEKE